MTFYVTPKNAHPSYPQKPVITCASHDETQRAIRKLAADGWGDEYSVVRGDLVCDFCSHPEIVKLYAITPGAMMFAIYAGPDSEGHLDADGLWGACEACHGMIQSGAWEHLLARSVESGAKLAQGVPLEVLKFTIRNAHGFFRNGWEALGKPDPQPVQSDDELLSGEE